MSNNTSCTECEAPLFDQSPDNDTSLCDTCFKASQCDLCEGTGIIETVTFDKDSNSWIPDGDKPCICQLKEKDYDEE